MPTRGRLGATNNSIGEWCPDCDDVWGYARICTVCGATLEQRPVATPVITSAIATAATAAFDLVPSA
jgi:hypothetical protein